MSTSSSRGFNRPNAFLTWLKAIITIALISGCVYGLWWGFNYWEEKNTPPIEYKEESVKKEYFETTIEATGTLEPEDLIDVGAQVGGLIQEFGVDADGKVIDYGSIVKEGDVLARIDDVLIKSDIKKAEAAVSQAKANVALAHADLSDAQAKYNLAASQRKRAERLGPSDALSQSSYDNYITNELAAKAVIALKNASIARADAALLEAEASLERAQLNLTYTTIISPVDGIIIDRRVNIGQTVVSSMSAPSLFLIAKDLRKLQIWAAVNEADIGLVKEGQQVKFTVDTFPKKEFKGTVKKIRLNATMTSNVVTYIVEITAPNPDLLLLPYLTTNTQFIVKQFPEALTVSNVALRWTPPIEHIAPDVTPQEGNRVWVKENSYLKPIPVKVIETNGTISVIESILTPEQKIITGIIDPTLEKTVVTTEEASNPFAPKMPKRKKPSTGTGSSTPAPH